MNRSALIPQSEWRCPIDGAAMTWLHAYANDGDIVERIVCACGHVRQRKVGRVLPDEHFDAIARRLFRDLRGAA